MGFDLPSSSPQSKPQSSPNPNPNPKSDAASSQPRCDECQSYPWKYRCPGCSILTCSLPCVKSHKNRTGCTGRKSHSEVVPLSKFDDNLLLSDYSFLEEAKRVAESARRSRYGIGGRCHYLPPHLKMLKGVASRRGAIFRILPYGMSKRQRNRSTYERRNKSILWTIEWRFHSTEVVMVDHRVDENMSICSVIEKHLSPGPWNHPLRLFCNEDIDNLKFFIQKNKGSKPLFRELKLRAPIRQQMAGVLIVEYPVIHVCLPSSSCEFQVEKFRSPGNVNKHCPQALEHLPSPKGTVFREEEIDDDGSSETIVVDLMQCRKPTDLVGPNNAKEDAATTAGADNPSQFLPKKSSEAPESILENKSWDYGEGVHTNASDFDFEQDLKDAYSNLIQEANPDGFLCFDGIGEWEQIESRQEVLSAYNENMQMGLVQGQLEVGELEAGQLEDVRLEEGELEEGEIPN